MKRLFFLIAALAFAPSVFAQTYILAPQAKYQPLSNLGLIVPGGKLCSFAAGTSTPLATYSDSSGTPNSNPVTLDSAGRANVRINGVAYKFVLYAPGTGNTCNGSSVGTLIWSVDNILDPGAYLYRFVTISGSAGSEVVTIHPPSGTVVSITADTEFIRVGRAGSCGFSGTATDKILIGCSGTQVNRSNSLLEVQNSTTGTSNGNGAAAFALNQYSVNSNSGFGTSSYCRYFIGGNQGSCFGSTNISAVMGSLGTTNPTLLAGSYNRVSVLSPGTIGRVRLVQAEGPLFEGLSSLAATFTEVIAFDYTGTGALPTGTTIALHKTLQAVDQSAYATSAYHLYLLGANMKNIVEGKVRIGSTTDPTVALDVNGIVVASGGNDGSDAANGSYGRGIFINGVGAANSATNAVISRLQSFGGGGGYGAWIVDYTGSGGAKPAKISVNGAIAASFELDTSAVFPGVVVGAPTGLFKGTGSINATSYWVNGTEGADLTLSCGGGEAVKTLTTVKGIVTAATCGAP